MKKRRPPLGAAHQSTETCDHLPLNHLMDEGGSERARDNKTLRHIAGAFCYLHTYRGSYLLALQALYTFSIFQKKSEKVLRSSKHSLLTLFVQMYRERNRILLPGSEWDRVVPRRQATTIYTNM